MAPPKVMRGWALVSDRTRYRGQWLPVVYQTRAEAEDDAAPDERLYRVTVRVEREATVRKFRSR
jgi:hypothetical protein